MGDPPHVDGVSHRWVHARGLDFHLGDIVLRPELVAERAGAFFAPA